MIVEAGLRLGDVEEHPTIDVTLDGADEYVAYNPCFNQQLISHSYRVDHQLNCVKGGGACHLREKVLAEAANTCVHFSTFVKIFSSYFLQVSSSWRIIEKTSSTLAPMYLFLLRYCQPWNDLSSPQVHPGSAYRSRTICLFQGASKFEAYTRISEGNITNGR